MTPVDDLNVGDWIAVVDQLVDPEPSQSPWEMITANCRPTYDGSPWRIKAISLPFIAVTDGKRNCALDVRRWAVQRVSKKYADSMYGKPAVKKKRVRVVVEEHNPQADECPKCRQRLVQRLIFENGEGHWREMCRSCDKQ